MKSDNELRRDSNLITVEPTLTDHGDVTDAEAETTGSYVGS